MKGLGEWFSKEKAEGGPPEFNPQSATRVALQHHPCAVVHVPTSTQAHAEVIMVITKKS